MDPQECRGRSYACGGAESGVVARQGLVGHVASALSRSLIVNKGRSVATWDVLLRISDEDLMRTKGNTDIARSVNGVRAIASLQIGVASNV